MSEGTENNPVDLLAALLAIQPPINESAKRRKHYKDMLKQPDPGTNQYSKFSKELLQNITKGTTMEEDVMIQLELIEEKGLSHILSYVDEKEMDALQLAAFYYGDAGVIEQIVRLQQKMIWKQRSGEFEGQTVLHIVIMRENIEGAKCLLQQKTGDGLSLLNVAATGSMFESTVMMGELPLSVAALTCNWEMVKLLIKKGASFWRGNSLGDTVFHSLVRFADLHPDKLEDVMDTLLRLHEKADTELQRIDVKVRDLWLIENKEGLTPLRLAAQLGEPELFKLILNLEGVYRHLDASEGLFDCVFYDITEVDPVASRRRFKTIKKETESKPSQRNGVQVLKKTARTPYQNNARTKGKKREAVGEPRNISVMEIICETSPDKQLFEIISTDVIREMIALKWESYHARFRFWAVLHLVFMSLLSAYTIYRSRIIGDELKAAQTGKGERIFVITTASISLFTPIIVIPLEVLMLGRKQPWKLTLLHHNGTYRLALITFSLLLFADAIWFLVPGSSQNYILVLAVLVGWWFTTFFLRPYKLFSFFTVMLQKVFVGDLLRFCVVIFLMWIAFSVAMHSAYLATADPDPPEEFKTFWLSALTMFQLVIGMADSAAVLGINDKMELSSGKIDPVMNFKGLAVFLYVVFVLITYVLMLNALIAMMSNTCTSVSEDRDMQWQYQRLSVVLMVENMTPTCGSCMKLCGEEKEVKRFDFKSLRTYTENRFFLKVKTATKTTLFKENSASLALLAEFVRQQHLDKMPFDSDNRRKDIEEKPASGDKTEVTIVMSAYMAAAALLQAIRGEMGKQPDGDETETATVSDTSGVDDAPLVTALVKYARKLIVKTLKQQGKKTSGDNGTRTDTNSKNNAIPIDAEEKHPRPRSRARRPVAPMPEMPDVYIIAPKFDTKGESTL